MKRPLAYITTPWSSNEAENTELAADMGSRNSGAKPLKQKEET